MSKNIIVLFAALAFAISLAGCATTGKGTDLEAQALRNQISVLEAQIESKDEQISALREALAKTKTGMRAGAAEDIARKPMREEKPRFTVKQVQIALQNAGYNPGPIDGRTGKQTREAIREFQRANGLKVDGKVGVRTWELLKGYLDRKIK